MDNLKTLLAEVGRIVQLDAKQREEGEKRGEMFNIFEILKVETDEPRVHSAFLAARLNPKGKHGAGDRFLRAFIDTMDCLKDFEFDTQDAKVEIEYPIGNKNEDATEGGRIDILITSTDGSKAVIIENKIYAGDQEKQLVRYNNYAKKVYSDYRLLYLNLYGYEASEYSAKEESSKTLQAGNDYYPIGYDKEIIDWLDTCIADAARLPLVRESIIQYQNLIKKLTNQNMEKEYSQQVLNAMLDNNNMDAVAAIAAQSETWRARIIQKLIDDLQKYAAEKGFEFQSSMLNEDGSLNSSCYQHISFSKWNKTSITIENEKGDYRQLAIGISCDTNIDIDPKPVFGRKTTKVWPYGWKYFDKYLNWTYEIMPDMNRGKVAEYIEGLVEEILKKIEDLKLPMP